MVLKQSIGTEICFSYITKTCVCVRTYIVLIDDYLLCLCFAVIAFIHFAYEFIFYKLWGRNIIERSLNSILNVKCVTKS